MEDLRSDLCKGLVPAEALLGRDGRVHEGFKQRFEDTAKTSQFSAALRDTPKHLVFTGHSLGAAVALIATLWLLHPNQPQLQLKLACITFGLPLTVDEHLSKHLSETGLNQ